MMTPAVALLSPRPPYFSGKVGADQPEIAHFLEHRAVDAVLPGALLVVRSELLPRKSLLRSRETPAAAR